MKQITLDKVLHFVITFIIAAVLTFAVKGAEITQPGILCGVYAAIVTMCIAIGKEVYDSFHGTSFDWMDILADFLGAILVVILALFL